MSPRKPQWRCVVTDTAKLCFAIAGFALAAAVIGAIANTFLSGWMAVTGMAAIALFYTALGLLNLSLEVSSILSQPQSDGGPEEHGPPVDAETSDEASRNRHPAPRRHSSRRRVVQRS